MELNREEGGITDGRKEVMSWRARVPSLIHSLTHTLSLFLAFVFFAALC